MTDVAQTGADEAFATEQRIKEIVRDMRRGWVILAGELYRFHRDDLWRVLGYGSFNEWRAGPDIDLSYRHVIGLIDAWRTLVVEGGVDPVMLEGVGVSKLRDALPAIRRGTVSVEQALADADALSRNDLRDKYEKAPALEGPDSSTVYDAVAEPQWARCPHCHSRYQVQP